MCLSGRTCLAPEASDFASLRFTDHATPARLCFPVCAALKSLTVKANSLNSQIAIQKKCRTCFRKSQTSTQKCSSDSSAMSLVSTSNAPFAWSGSLGGFGLRGVKLQSDGRKKCSCQQYVLCPLCPVRIGSHQAVEVEIVSCVMLCLSRRHKLLP